MQCQCGVLNLHTVQVKFITHSLSLVVCIHGSPVELIISHLTLHEAPHAGCCTTGTGSLPGVSEDFTYLNQKERCKWQSIRWCTELGKDDRLYTSIDYITMATKNYKAYGVGRSYSRPYSNLNSRLWLHLGVCWNLTQLEL